MEERVISSSLVIKGVENQRIMQEYFSPQIILPEKTSDFFLIHPHHLIMFKDVKIMAIAGISGNLERLNEIKQNLEDISRRAKYGWNDLFSNIGRHLYTHLFGRIKEILETCRSEEEIKGRVISIAFEERTLKQVLDLFAGISPSFIRLLPSSLAGHISAYILNRAEKLVEVFEPSSTESFRILDEMILALYKSRIIFPIMFTRVCTNVIEAHYDFLLSDFPSREGTCRICGCPAVTFGLYLINEPYASFKERQEDLSFIIAAYVSAKGAGEVECFPEIYVKRDSNEEQIDILFRNLVRGTTAIAECKITENPRATYETKVNIVGQALKQLKRKMNLVNSNFGYLVTNLCFESEEEAKSLLGETIKRIGDKVSDNIKLLGKIRNKEVISEWDIILSDIRHA